MDEVQAVHLLRDETFQAGAMLERDEEVAAEAQSAQLDPHQCGGAPPSLLPSSNPSPRITPKGRRRLLAVRRSLARRIRDAGARLEWKECECVILSRRLLSPSRAVAGERGAVKMTGVGCSERTMTLRHENRGGSPNPARRNPQPHEAPLVDCLLHISHCRVRPHMPCTILG